MKNYTISEINGVISCEEGLSINDFVDYLKSLEEMKSEDSIKENLFKNNSVFKLDKKLINSCLIETDSKHQLTVNMNIFYLLEKGEVLSIKTKDSSITIGVKQDSSLLISKDPISCEVIREELRSKLSEYEPGTIEYQAINWLENGERGLSSLALCYHLTTDKIKNKINDMEKRVSVSKDHPHDSADFGRCVKFFEMVPLAKENLYKMSGVSKEWSELVNIWPNLLDKYCKAQSETEDIAKNLYREISDSISSVIYPKSNSKPKV